MTQHIALMPGLFTVLQDSVAWHTAAEHFLKLRKTFLIFGGYGKIREPTLRITELQFLNACILLPDCTQILPLRLDFLKSRIACRIFFIHLLQALMIFGDLITHLGKALLVHLPCLLPRCYADFLTKRKHVLRFGCSFFVQPLNLFHKRLQLRPLPLSLLLLIFQFEAVISDFVEPSTVSAVCPKPSSIVPQLFLSGIVVAEVIRIIHQIAELCTNRSCGFHVPGRQL